MADAGQPADVEPPGEQLGVQVGVVGSEPVGEGVESDGGYADGRLVREPLLDRGVPRIARGDPTAVTVGVDDGVDEVGVVEARRGRGERRLGVGPGRRPLPPEQAAQVVGVAGEAVAAPLGEEVVGIPGSALRRGRKRLIGVGDVLDVLAARGHQPLDPLG